jgi:hypothetical protein
VKYQTGGAFRRALEQRLRNQSLQTGVPLVRLRKMVAFDRFLARLFQRQPDDWVVKGGLALQLRLGDRARTTMDIDMLALSSHQVTAALREAGSMNLGDWFTFEVAAPVDTTGANTGGIRHTIQALLDGRTFEQFHIDVGIGDPLVDPVEYLNTPAILEFANLASTRVPCYPITQQIAEKLHAYTRPHKTGESSRVKDFIDIILLTRLGVIDGERLLQAIQATFISRDTHVLPIMIPPPPSNWDREFQRMASEVGLERLSLESAFHLLQRFLNPLLENEILGSWNPVVETWH